MLMLMLEIRWIKIPCSQSRGAVIPAPSIHECSDVVPAFCAPMMNTDGSSFDDGHCDRVHTLGTMDLMNGWTSKRRSVPSSSGSCTCDVDVVSRCA